MYRQCKECNQEYGHDQDCSKAAWFETREYLEGPRTEGRVTLPAYLIADMLDGIYGKGTRGTS